MFFFHAAHGPGRNRTRSGAIMAKEQGKGLTYAQAGVDIDAGNALVKAITPLAAATARPGADAGLGGFGGLFDLGAAGYREPLLVAATDGVGTKVLLAIEAGQHATIGIDLVAMCVNDLIVQGAEPLFFLDYFATGRLAVEDATEVVKGVAKGCTLAGCALIGGETAEMPGMYDPGHYDLAGFAVGAVEREALLPQRGRMQAGDILVGLASSGPHSNGYSLIRKVVERAGLKWDDPAPFDGNRPLAQALLTPTRIYVAPVLRAQRQETGAKGYAHITGGGLPENLPRVLPAELAAHVHLDALPCWPVFQWLREAGGIAEEEMLRTFNCGVGMVAIVGRENADEFMLTMANEGERPFILGELTARESGGPQVIFDGALTGSTA